MPTPQSQETKVSHTPGPWRYEYMNWRGESVLWRPHVRGNEYVDEENEYGDDEGRAPHLHSGVHRRGEPDKPRGHRSECSADLRIPRIVSDRAAGGRMTTSQDNAVAVADQLRAAITLARKGEGTNV